MPTCRYEVAGRSKSASKFHIGSELKSSKNFCRRWLMLHTFEKMLHPTFMFHEELEFPIPERLNALFFIIQSKRKEKHNTTDQSCNISFIKKIELIETYFKLSNGFSLSCNKFKTNSRRYRFLQRFNMPLLFDLNIIYWNNFFALMPPQICIILLRDIHYHKNVTV